MNVVNPVFIYGQRQRLGLFGLYNVKHFFSDRVDLCQIGYPPLQTHILTKFGKFFRSRRQARNHGVQTSIQ